MLGGKNKFCDDILNALCRSPFKEGLVTPAVGVLFYREPSAVNPSGLAFAGESQLIHGYTLPGTAYIIEFGV